MDKHFDLVVIGSGPAGQKAAVQAAKLKKTVALIDKSREVGGSCVYRGTIPSKTLRENALRIRSMRMNAATANFKLNEDIELATLIQRLEKVLSAHDEYLRNQLTRNNIELIHGRAHFESTQHLRVTCVNGATIDLGAEKIIIAAGSYPRKPDNIDIDHEHLFDSDSILSMMYLPKTLTVLGGGVIASEYASIFQALGVKVTMVDRYPSPLGFLDSDLCDTFVRAFEAMGGCWRGNAKVKTAYWNGVDAVITELENGEHILSEKLLCAAGRLANVEHLKIENAGLHLNDRGLIDVNSGLQTLVSDIYAAGDVIGPPSLASASMEQGRRASCNAFDAPIGETQALIPSGIYSIPELSSVGMSEKEAIQNYGESVVGRAHFKEIARGQISGIQDGMLKIVCDSAGMKVLGVMIIGEGATELIHIGQMALLSNADVDIFVESIFNFPTLAEAYRVAALDVIGQRNKRRSAY
jgi:NAD(P) transhydrogenase